MQTLAGKQRGLTFISLVFLLCIIGFFALLIIKIGPIYFNHSKVVDAVEAVKNTPDISSQTRGQILSALQKRFDMNFVDFISSDDIHVVSQPGFVEVDIDYERVVHIMGNLSVLAEFHEGFKIGEQ